MILLVTYDAIDNETGRNCSGSYNHKNSDVNTVHEFNNLVFEIELAANVRKVAIKSIQKIEKQQTAFNRISKGFDYGLGIAFAILSITGIIEIIKIAMELSK